MQTIAVCGQMTPGLHDLNLGPQVGYDRPGHDIDSPPEASRWWESNPVPERIWMEKAPNLPPCSQRTDQLYTSVFMSDDYGVYQHEPSDVWLNYMEFVDDAIIDDRVFFLLVSLYVWLLYSEIYTLTGALSPTCHQAHYIFVGHDRTGTDQGPARARDDF